jgi:stress response protein YsnF
VPVSREVVDVSKRTVRTGELEVTKERDQHTETVTDTARREVVEVDDTTAKTKQGR